MMNRKLSPFSAPRVAAALAALALLPCIACAQSNPRLVDSAAAPAAPVIQPAPQAVSQPPQASQATDDSTIERVGDVTHRLLAAQASGAVAGPGLPMLGATATLAYQRYLDSFTHKIPTFFETRVQAQSNGGGMSGAQ